GVRHNVDTMTAAGGHIERLVAVGGGTQGTLWTQIVSDVTGLPQVIPSQTIGASYGAAFLAASAFEPVAITDWNPTRETREPNPPLRGTYDELYALYRDLYDATRSITHTLADRERRLATDSRENR